ncbi:MAG: class A beta-lactamase-related serine hydrolase [Deltaproteobacteria bacterium]|nr:MAG: class A beta-lactamase-related serine hydrolase [Deltaproteobacteria bacterium]
MQGGDAEVPDEKFLHAPRRDPPDVHRGTHRPGGDGMIERIPLDIAEERIRPFPPEVVTSREGSAEVPAEAGGMRPEDVEAIWNAVVGLYRHRLHPAIALSIRRKGAVILDRAIGHLRGNAPDDPEDAPKISATPKTLFNLFSASKAVTAMVVHLLNERNLVHLDDPVAEYVPAFGQRGKGWITLRHVLTHRAGIPSVPDQDLDLDILTDFDEIFGRLCALTPQWKAGRRLAYHALTGGYVIDAVVRAVTGCDIRTFLHREILDPLGFRDFSYGVPENRLGEVARHAFTGPPARPPYSWLMKRVLGVSIREAVEISNDPRFLTAIVPSGNIITTANEACRFFQLLLDGGELDGVRLFDPRTIRRAVAEQSYLEFDLMLCLPVRYGMGFMLGDRRFSIYGPETPKAFGHLGFTNVVVYADPQRAISVALMTSGKPFITPRAFYWYNVMRTIAQRCPRIG